MNKLNLSQLVGYGLVGLSIIISGFIVANKLPQASYVPDRLYVTADSELPAVKEFMSTIEAACFINMSEDNFIPIVKSGELNGTFFIINDTYIFSKEKLTQWMNEQIDDYSSSG